ncbi:hypothetical protein ACF8EA_23385 [Pseudomonas sp. YQ_5]|uniref:hypothetical protein n=1 Tax=Pseudomonas sp. YQ_5 TaxID=3367229 RepID=UPI00370CCCEC
MTLPIKYYIAQSGERVSFLFAPDSLFYPAAYVSRQLRENHTHQTKTAASDGIRRLGQQERDRRISLKDRLFAGKLLSPHEIDDLAGHM